MNTIGPGRSYDPDQNAEIIADHVSFELERFRDQQLTPEVINTLRNRVADSIGDLLGHGGLLSIESGLEVKGGRLFDQLTSPTSIILREHFDNFADCYDLPKKRTTRTFNWLVDGNEDGSKLFVTTPGDPKNPWKQSREPMPLAGVVLVKREDLDLGRYENQVSDYRSRVISEYGIQADSLISTDRSIREGTRYDHSTETLRQIAVVLTKQIR